MRVPSGDGRGFCCPTEWLSSELSASYRQDLCWPLLWGSGSSLGNPAIPTSPMVSPYVDGCMVEQSSAHVPRASATVIIYETETDQLIQHIKMMPLQHVATVSCNR